MQKKYISNETKVLTEHLEVQTKEIEVLTEQLDIIKEEFEKKVEVLTEEKLLLEQELVEEKAHNYAYKLLSKNIELRPFADKLLECKSTREVDLVFGILKTHVPKVEFPTTQKGLGVFETVSDYLTSTANKEITSKIKLEYKENENKLSPEDKAELRLAGININ